MRCACLLAFYISLTFTKPCRKLFIQTYCIQAEFEEVARNLSSAKYLKNSGECVEKKSDTEYNFRFWLDATYQQDTWKVINFFLVSTP